MQRHLKYLFLMTWAVLFLGASPAFAVEPWLTLPPTPELPKPDSSGRVTVPGAQIWYATFGEGAPIVLLHGGLGNSNYFGDVIPSLVPQRKVIVIDSRGQGRSTNDGRQLTYHLMAEDVIAVLDHLHVMKTDVLGWSDGAIIGMDIAMNHPDRVTKFFCFGGDSSVSGFLDVSKSPTFNAYLDRVHKEYLQLNPYPGQWEAIYANANRMWSVEPNLSDDQLKSIHVKTWIVDADHEEVIAPTDTHRMFSLIPNAREMILPGVSHFAILQDPALFVDAVKEFLVR
jgi:pimeloyl-ACP methyl ester carboxylesterase